MLFLQSFFARNTLTGKDTFYFDRFFEDTGDLENCFSLRFERVFKDRVSPQVQALFQKLEKALLTKKLVIKIILVLCLESSELNLVTKKPGKSLWFCFLDFDFLKGLVNDEYLQIAPYP